MKITIGITSYNRANYLEKCAKSLVVIDNLNNCNVRIYDDCSTEYDTAFLKKLFPYAKEIIRREKNMKSDKNIALMYENFLNTGDDILINADSDLIFRADVITLVNKLLPKTDGILSLYNSTIHKSIEEIDVDGEKLLIKNDLGSAGTVFSREIVEKIMKNVNSGINFDWRWSEYLKNSGYKILCVKNSYVQHLGLEGQNNDGIRYDYGLGFIPGNKINQEIMSLHFEDMVLDMGNRVEFVLKNNPEYRIGYWFTNPWPSLKKLFKK